MKFADMPKDKQQNIVTEATNGLVSAATLLNAARHFKAGRMGHALFFAILWHGFNFNAESGRTAKRHKEMHNCQHEMNKMFASAGRKRTAPPIGVNPTKV